MSEFIWINVWCLAYVEEEFNNLFVSCMVLLLSDCAIVFRTRRSIINTNVQKLYAIEGKNSIIDRSLSKLWMFNDQHFLDYQDQDN